MTEDYTQQEGPMPAEDATDAFMRELKGLEPLDHSRLVELAHTFHAHEERFRAEIVEVAGIEDYFLDIWLDAKRAGRRSGRLSEDCESSRDASNDSDDRRVDAAFSQIEALVADRTNEEEEAGASLSEAAEASAKEAARILASVRIRFDLLREGATWMRGQLDRATRLRRPVRAGISTADCRRALARAEASLAARDRARDEMASRNLRLVVHVARRYRAMGVPLLDLIQEGGIGLLRAIDKFDPDRGFRFSSYAVWWIEQAMIRAVQSQSRTIKLPSHVWDQQRRYRKCEEHRFNLTGRSPMDEELASDLDITAEQSRLLGASLRAPISIDLPTAQGEGEPLSARLPDEEGADTIDALDEEKLQTRLQRALKRLSTRERKALELRFGLKDGNERSLRETGELLGCSGERVRQIQFGALEKLRSLEGLSEFMGYDDVADTSRQ